VSALSTPHEACERLGVDAWALDRLVDMGEIAPGPDGRFKSEDVEILAKARLSRRAEAIADITALDAPHLGLTP
jgi:hypothetical protein